MAYCQINNPRALPLIPSVRGPCVEAISDADDALTPGST
jgi:hypothetical protein